MTMAKAVTVQAMITSRLAGHEHCRAPCNLNYRGLYCSRGVVWVYRKGLLYTFASVFHVSRPVHVTNTVSCYLMNVLRPRLQVAWLQSRLIVVRLPVSNLLAISI